MTFWEIMLAIITTVVGALLGWIITVRTTKNKKPLWFCCINPLFQRGVTTIPDLGIKYKGNDIGNLSSIFFAFWNDGKETITQDAIAETLCIVTRGKIFDAQVIHFTNESNQFIVSVSDDQTSAGLGFKYLDYKQGAVVQIFSDVSDISALQFEGAIMGCKKFRNTKYSNKNNLKIMMLSGFSYVLSTLVGVGITYIISISTLHGNPMILLMVLSLISGAVIMAGIIAVMQYIRVTWYRMPKEFRKYFGSTQ